MRRILLFLVLGMGAAAGGIAVATVWAITPVEKNFHKTISDAHEMRITDRTGQAISISYQNQWNLHQQRALYDIPEDLKRAFVISEDKRFFQHGGPDWRARGAALLQNITKGRAVRGASTITEQVVRMIQPRPRNIWSRWIEGFEAARLERHRSKTEILEFYLNQVPYASHRRGVAQAAQYYFARDLSTLSVKEMLALAVLVRAPSAYDLYRDPRRIEAPLMRLADQMDLSDQVKERLQRETLVMQKPEPTLEARHFARYVYLASGPQARYQTTLDPTLQTYVQKIIDSRLSDLKSKDVMNAAALVADHKTGDILAWVVGGAASSAPWPGVEIDAVITPRQPGSALKPFLYASALESGWTPATILNDAPMTEAIGAGIHNFKNYSNIYYGPVSLREALGNSLNIPALLTIRHVGPAPYLETLQKLGFENLTRHAGIYHDGLALGNGEVSLFEMVQAYAALANRGHFQSLKYLKADPRPQQTRRIFSSETASLIGHILSDPWARRLEFGQSGVLNLPVQTAVKTGTSTDYRDAWTLGYNDRYVVGVWMGNLDRKPTKGVTGSTGPALALRSIFDVLNHHRETQALYMSPHLEAQDICAKTASNRSCVSRTEWFDPRHPYRGDISKPESQFIELVRPTDGLQIAKDPRIPASFQKLRFELRGADDADVIEWRISGKDPVKTQTPTFLWAIEKGAHSVQVHVHRHGQTIALEPVKFIVK